MVMPMNGGTAYSQRRATYAAMRRSMRRGCGCRRGHEVVRALIARNPPIHFAGVPREQSPAVALLHVLDALVHGPLHRHLNYPRVRLIGGEHLVELLIHLHAFVEVELAPRVLDQLVRDGIDVVDEVL